MGTTSKHTTRVFYRSDIARIERDVRRKEGLFWGILAVVLLVVGLGVTGTMDYETQKAEGNYQSIREK